MYWHAGKKTFTSILLVYCSKVATIIGNKALLVILFVFLRKELHKDFIFPYSGAKHAINYMYMQVGAKCGVNHDNKTPK